MGKIKASSQKFDAQNIMTINKHKKYVARVLNKNMCVNKSDVFLLILKYTVYRVGARPQA